MFELSDLLEKYISFVNNIKQKIIQTYQIRNMADNLELIDVHTTDNPNINPTVTEKTADNPNINPTDLMKNTDLMMITNQSIFDDKEIQPVFNSQQIYYIKKIPNDGIKQLRYLIEIIKCIIKNIEHHLLEKSKLQQEIDLNKLML